MIKRQSSLRVAAALLAPTLSFACAQSGTGEEETESLGAASQAIINGNPTVGAEYAAVGALVYYYPEVGVLDVFCSGTLVAAKAITTATVFGPTPGSDERYSAISSSERERRLDRSYRPSRFTSTI